MALRNVVHFNCINPFPCCDGSGNKSTLIKKKDSSAQGQGGKHEKSFYSKNPYGDDMAQIEEIEA